MDNKIDSQLQNYAEVFDFYIERGQLPPPYQGDMLAEYMKAVLDEPENQHIYQQDSTWREILKVSLLDFFNGLLPFFNTYDEKKREEQVYIGAFLHADIEGKRAMWFELEEYVSKTYSETAVNMNGYVQQLKEGKHEKEDIFQAMANDWKDAMDRRFENAKQNLLRINNKNFGIRMKEAGKEDYEMMNRTKRIFYKYPVLKEILRLIGREKEENKEEHDEVITRFLPFLISPNQSIEDIDGITIGNELHAILPSELSLLSDPNTEVLFYQKYASKQLQLFSNKPPTIKKEKKEVQKKITPRLIEGPIIVSIDTSGSMVQYGQGQLDIIYSQQTHWDTLKIQRWLRIVIRDSIIERAKEVLPVRAHYWEQTKDLYASKITVSMSLRKNVMGNCSWKKEIRLAPIIVLFPQQYMDEVILHEMAHLKFMHHRKSFWQYLSILLGKDARQSQKESTLFFSRYADLFYFIIKK